MADENHLKNVGRSIAKGTKNASEALSRGRLMDATESTWEGAVTVTKETAKSAVDSASELAEGIRDES